jgi:DNA-binding SARP family transcriptional activator
MGVVGERSMGLAGAVLTWRSEFRPAATVRAPEMCHRGPTASNRAARTSNDVTFRLLGRLEVVAHGRVIPLRAGKLVTLLATLLLRANRTASYQDLFENLWDGAAPEDARSVTQKYVMRLRNALADVNAVIHTEPEGYRLEIDPGRLDLERSRELMELAARASAAGDLPAAAEHIDAALELWRELTPLANVPSERIQLDEVPRLVERYLQAQELRLDVQQKLGRHAEVCEQTLALLARHPYHEGIWARRIRSLSATGRQGEALEAYRQVANLLTSELGVDPGAELRALHEQILRSVPVPPSGEHSGQRTPSANRTPIARQLPMQPSRIIDREREIESVVRALTASSNGAPRLVVLSGAPGIGKTAVALAAAHRIADRFPDGQLFADLGGKATRGRREADVLARFLECLGAPENVPPYATDAAATAFRSLTAGRRMLVMIDGAVAAAQVRALLPGSSTCSMIVTSRHALTGLLVSPGAHRVQLDVLTTRAGVTVLSALLGAGRVDAQRRSASELVELCGGLPLALRIAAAHLVAEPALPIAAYVHRLRTEGPVSVLRVAGDRRLSMEHAVATSYEQLGRDERSVLHQMSRVPGEEVFAEQLEDAAGTGGPDIPGSLERLVDCGLLSRRPNGSYVLHIMTRAFLLGSPRSGGAAEPVRNAEELRSLDRMQPL